MSNIKKMFKKSSKRIKELRKNIEETEEHIKDEAKRIRKAYEKGELNDNQKEIAMKALNSSVKTYGRQLISLQEELVEQTGLLQQLKEQPDNDLIAANENIAKDLQDMREQALDINQLSNLRNFTDNAETIIKTFEDSFEDL